MYCFKVCKNIVLGLLIIIFSASCSKFNREKVTYYDWFYRTGAKSLSNNQDIRLLFSEEDKALLLFRGFDRLQPSEEKHDNENAESQVLSVTRYNQLSSDNETNKGGKAKPEVDIYFEELLLLDDGMVEAFSQMVSVIENYSFRSRLNLRIPALNNPTGRILSQPTIPSNSADAYENTLEPDRRHVYDLGSRSISSEDAEKLLKMFSRQNPIINFSPITQLDVDYFIEETAITHIITYDLIGVALPHIDSGGYFDLFIRVIDAKNGVIRWAGSIRAKN
jgi:hypothetical protein